MKVFFVSDLQLGVGIDLGYGEYGPGSRFQDQRDNLDAMAAYAISEGVGLVGVLGDIFERSRPAPWEILAFQSFVRTLTEAGIRVLVILGNHDVRSAALPPALSIFQGAGCEVALSPSIYPAGDVVVAALPWTPTSRLIAQQPGTGRDEIHDLASQALVKGAHVLGARCHDEYPGVTPILVGHWAITGASLPTGLDVSHLREPVIPLEGLTSAGFSLAAFGHIHKPQLMVSSPTPVFYCGSATTCNWGESTVEHGGWLYDTAGAGSLKFVQFPDRPFVTIDVDFAEGEDFSMLMESYGDWSHVKDALVRVRYSCTEEQKRTVDETAVRKALMGLGASKVFLRPSVERAVRSRVEGSAAEGLTEADGLELWLASQEVPDPNALRALHAAYVARAA